MDPLLKEITLPPFRWLGEEIVAPVGEVNPGVQGLLGSVSPSQSASPGKGSLHTVLLVFSLGYSVEMELLIKVRAQTQELGTWRG